MSGVLPGKKEFLESLKPFCSKCFTNDPEPVETDQKDMVHWFCIEPHAGLDEKGEVKPMFAAIVEKDFDYDEEEDGELLCPDCMVDEVEDNG